jgi:hypothetical protein
MSVVCSEVLTAAAHTRDELPPHFIVHLFRKILFAISRGSRCAVGRGTLNISAVVEDSERFGFGCICGRLRAWLVRPRAQGWRDAHRSTQRAEMGHVWV